MALAAVATAITGPLYAVLCVCPFVAAVTASIYALQVNLLSANVVVSLAEIDRYAPG